MLHMLCNIPASWRVGIGSLLFVLVLAFGLVSCNNDEEIAHYTFQPVEQNVWDRQQSFDFSLDTVRHGGNYKVQVCLRTSQNIQFQRLYVTVEQKLGKSKVPIKDTLCLTLTDEMGNMEGKGLSLFNYSAELPREVSLAQGQTGTISICHIMQRMQLTGINQVGLKIYRQR